MGHSFEVSRQKISGKNTTLLNYEDAINVFKAV